MTVQVNAKADDIKTLSDQEQYDAEWGDDAGSDAAAAADSAVDDAAEKPAEGTTVTPPAVVTGEGDTNTPAPAKASAESAATDDPWAAVPEELRQAHQRVQNDVKSVAGRHAAAERRAEALDKEVKAAKAQLAELTRNKGTYEKEHPELFNEVLQVVKAKLPEPAPAAATPVEDDAIKTVYKVHPDVDDVMGSADWAMFQKDFTPAQKAQFNSSDPFEFAALVTSFKEVRAVKQHASRTEANQAKLAAAAVAPVATASRAAPRTRMSDQEAYEAEWAKDL